MIKVRNLVLSLMTASLLITGCSGQKNETSNTSNDDAENQQGLAFYLLDDDTYGVGVGTASYLSNIVIPDTYKGKPVTRIIKNAFSTDVGGLLSEKTITIPSSIKYIDDYAFYGSGIEAPKELIYLSSFEDFNNIIFGDAWLSYEAAAKYNTRFQFSTQNSKKGFTFNSIPITYEPIFHLRSFYPFDDFRPIPYNDSFNLYKDFYYYADSFYLYPSYKAFYKVRKSITVSEINDYVNLASNDENVLAFDNSYSGYSSSYWHAKKDGTAVLTFSAEGNTYQYNVTVSSLKTFDGAYFADKYVNYGTTPQHLDDVIGIPDGTIVSYIKTSVIYGTFDPDSLASIDAYLQEGWRNYLNYPNSYNQHSTFTCETKPGPSYDVIYVEYACIFKEGYRPIVLEALLYFSE